ncbi:MAG: DUF3465 domain-containing protein [Xanthomonadales bacterium]|nr:DUF3465 domain-containing protein [Gammaproteobacteria bacterium]NNK05457.1 DUF3465 domain-containing protein [Xanthomonadales bacterium]
MRKSLIIPLFAALLAYAYFDIKDESISAPNSWSTGVGNTIQQAFVNELSDIQVQGKGVVVRILPDDLEGSRHQKFILKLSGGPSLLVAHNIDLSRRLEGLAKGDVVEFNGEYEWNSQGGVLHWTHDDPDNRHVGGWLKYKGMEYH